MNTISLDLTEITGTSPPSWANGEQPWQGFWYFVNQYDEPWLALLAGDRLKIIWLDDRWYESGLTIDEAEGALNVAASFVCREQSEPRGDTCDVAGMILEVQEAHWLAAVLTVAVDKMKMQRRHGVA